MNGRTLDHQGLSLCSTDKMLAVGLVGSVVGLLALLACCAGVDHVAGAPKNGIRVELLQRDIEEQLLPGSTRGEVEAWFASHDIEPSEIVHDNVAVGLWASIPNDSWLGRATIRIELHFDANNRLKDRVVYRDVPSL
jgi:hypothetical protein